MARSVNSYDLYAAHAWYAPGVGGMFALVGWFLVGALLGSLVQAVALAFVPRQLVLDYGMIVIYPIQFLPAMLYAARKSQRNALFEKGYALDSGNFSPLGTPLAVVLTILLTFSGVFVFDLVNYGNMQLTLRSPSLAHAYELFMEVMKQMTGGPFWSSFLTVAVLAPIFEEWLCRGMVLRGLLTHVKPVWAIVLSALFFAVIHANPWQALNAFLIGVLMGYVYYRTGSLKLTMLMHFLNNGTAVILSHIESLKEYDYWIDMLGKTNYMIVFCVSLVVLCVSLALLRKIPIAHPWGNLDPVE